MHKAISLRFILLVIVLTTIIAIPPVASGEPTVFQTTKENSWTEMTPLPAPRSGLGVATVNDEIYAIGGRVYKHAGQTVGTNEMYDPASNNWTTKTPMPTARALFGCVAYGGKIYCIGGETDNIVATNSNMVYLLQ